MSRLGRWCVTLTALPAVPAIGLLAATPSYADGTVVEPDPGGGIPGWFVGLFILAAIFGIGTTLWRVTTAQKLARRSGMDPGLATQMTLLSDDGLDTTYLASSLRQSSPAPTSAPTPAHTASSASRLEELKSLLDRGLVTQAEYDERRKAIIDSV
jgi:Short C-terminal domain